MGNITTPADLKNAVLLLETEQVIHLQNLREQFFLSYESLKPARLIESALKEVASSPYLVNNILITFIGLTTRYIAQKAAKGKSNTKLKKLFGYILQFGLTKLVTQNPDAIKSIGKYIEQKIFPQKEMNQAE